jgi:hypothetical protein
MADHTQKAQKASVDQNVSFEGRLAGKSAESSQPALPVSNRSLAGQENTPSRTLLSGMKITFHFGKS